MVAAKSKKKRRTGRQVRRHVHGHGNRAAPPHHAAPSLRSPGRPCSRRDPSELGIPNSTLSHHLEKLKNEDLVKVRRESTFLWYTANTEALEELLGFLYAECCTRNKAIKPEAIVTLCK